MSAARSGGALLLSGWLALAAGSALAVPQAPHDAAHGINCTDCHAPYASLNDPPSSSGAATSGSGTTSLADSSKAWTANQWVGGIVTITSGANQGQFRPVTANTASGLSWALPLPSALAVGASYRLGKTTYRDVETRCKSCHNPTGMASTMPDVGLHVVNGGATLVGCGKCHDPHNIEPNSGAGQALIRATVRWPSARNPVPFPSGGVNRFVTGAPANGGICETCHTRTTHFRNDGSAADQSHSAFVPDLATGACTNCHAHNQSFSPDCVTCHGVPPIAADEDYPGGGGAHRHHFTDQGYACAACHAGNSHNEGNGTVLAANIDVSFAARTFPGGTTSANGGTPSESHNAGNPTCVVGCHNPIIVKPVNETPNLANSASWTTSPLACTDCHDTQGAMMDGGIVSGVRYRSAHPFAPGAAATRADCCRCHDTTAHTDGVVQVSEWLGVTGNVTGADPHELDGFCYSCHDGAGGTLKSLSPPTVAGFFSPGGDFHGARAGAGWGGTLESPYVRGEPALPCRACHEPHASANALLFKANVNGNPIPAGAIDAAGRGAEKLCSSCHQGETHQGCIGSGCHGWNPIRVPEKCFWCHTHNGIERWPSPFGVVEPDCWASHCHTTWYPWDPDVTPPTITSGPTVTFVNAVSATITWTTNEGAYSFVDYGLVTPSSTKSNYAVVLTHSVTVTGLARASTYLYRVRSQDPSGNPVTSGNSNFTTLLNDLPSIPVLTPRADLMDPNPTVSPALAWAASTDVDGDPSQYEVVVSTTADFAALVASSGWLSALTWSPALPNNASYYWRVRARDANYPGDVTGWSAPDLFECTTRLPPPAPVLVDQPDQQWALPPAVNVTLSWGAVSAPDGDPVEYQVQLSSSNFASIDATSPWLSGTSWTVSAAVDTQYSWRVQARDSVHPAAASPWSAVDTFILYKSSCPFIFVWNGTGYDYVTDVQGPVIGLAPSVPTNQSIRFFQPSYVRLDGLSPDAAGEYRVKLRETLHEVTYLDEAKLVVVDVPSGYEVYSSTAENTYAYGYVNPFRLITARAPLPLVSATNHLGADVLAQLTLLDDQPAPVAPNFDETYTLDFGPFFDVTQARLLFDTWAIYGTQLGGTGFVQPFLEVKDGSGNWTKVKSFGAPAGDFKTMVIDVSNLFLGSDRKVRVHLGIRFGARWVIDRVRLDDSAQVPVQTMVLAASSADLHHRGRVPYLAPSMTHRLSATDGTLPDNPAQYASGYFTRYGDAGALVSVTDDQYAIMRHGDEVTLIYPALAPPASGMVRRFLLKTDLYYKQHAATVEPLPYHGMTTYPWVSPEHYPDDQAHLDYRALYNTRYSP